MGLVRFVNTIGQILNCESVGPTYGLSRHISWQFRRIFKMFPVELKISNSRIFVEYPSGVAALVNCMGVYDFNDMNLIKIILEQRGGTFFDGGANIGDYTLVASEIPDALVVSFEPHPQIFPALVRNIQLNSRSNVIPMNMALSDQDDTVFLTDEAEVSRIVDDRNVNGIRVQGRTMDSICRELKINPLIVKLDVEGHERSVLMGFQAEMGSTELFIIEHGYRVEIKEIMESRGFDGPFFFHLAQKAFVSYPQRRPEDPIYIRHTFIDRLAEFGLEVR